MSFVCKQDTILLPGRKRGSYLVTADVESRAHTILQAVSCGTAHLFLLHTSASLSISENADPLVRSDMTRTLHALIPDGEGYDHSYEGSDDMPAHVLSTMIGCELTIPVRDGHFQLGTWQGIYLNEHRKFGGDRKILITVQGSK